MKQTKEQLQHEIDRLRGDCYKLSCLYRGPYSIETVRKYATGNTTFENANHIREGVVVKPEIESSHPKIGRKILKYINDDYLIMKESKQDLDTPDDAINIEQDNNSLVTSITA